MKEHVITYSAAMIRARREGRKTQTRRVYKPHGKFPYQDGEDTGNPSESSTWTEWGPCPYGKPGDRLVVKEAAWMWCAKIIDRNRVTKKTGKPKVAWMECRNVQPIYCADHPEKPTHVPSGQRQKNGDVQYCWHKKNARFLPRWASRGLDEVVSIRVERLNEITHLDAIAEGCQPHPDCQSQSCCDDYRRLWESINGPGSWDANPWVWVVTFKTLS